MAWRSCPDRECRTQIWVEGKEGIRLEGDWQVVLLLNASYCKHHRPDSENLSRRKSKTFGSCRFLNQVCKTFKNLYVCPLHRLWIQIYTLASSSKSDVSCVIQKWIRKAKLVNAKAEGRGESIMRCPPSETAAATPPTWITLSPDSDLTPYVEIQRWTLHTVTKLGAAQLASRDRVITQSSIAIDNFMKNNYTPGHKNCVLLEQSAI